MLPEWLRKNGSPPVPPHFEAVLSGTCAQNADESTVLPVRRNGSCFSTFDFLRESLGWCDNYLSLTWSHFLLLEAKQNVQEAIRREEEEDSEYDASVKTNCAIMAVYFICTFLGTPKKTAIF